MRQRGVGFPRGQRRRPLRVLVADDQASIRSLVRRVLGHHECEVIGEAEDGITAVSLALAHEPDLVIMDVHMPSLDGIEATRKIKAALPRTMVVGFSSKEADARALLAAGAADFFEKHELGRLVATYCDPRTAQDEGRRY